MRLNSAQQVRERVALEVFNPRSGKQGTATVGKDPRTGNILAFTANHVTPETGYDIFQIRGLKTGKVYAQAPTRVISRDRQNDQAGLFLPKSIKSQLDKGSIAEIQALEDIKKAGAIERAWRGIKLDGSFPKDKPSDGANLSSPRVVSNNVFSFKVQSGDVNHGSSGGGVTAHINNGRKLVIGTLSRGTEPGVSSGSGQVVEANPFRSAFLGITAKRQSLAS